MITLYKNIAYKLELVVLDNDGKFAPGLTITYEIRKVSDDSLFASGTMSETSSVYYVDVTFLVSAEYKVKYVTPTGYENGFDEILVEDYNNYKADVSALALDSTVAKDATVAKDSTVAKETTLNSKSSQTSVDAVKTDTESIITTLSTLVVDIWTYTTRTLTSFGTLVADIWSYVTRTITSGGITASEVWTYITRTLTSGTKDSEIDAIKTQTDKIPRLLGLSMENHRIFNPVYDVNNCLTSATIKIYPTKADVLADTNVIATYAMVATFDADGKCLTYRMTKE
jgi:hypothetical protein